MEKILYRILDGDITCFMHNLGNFDGYFLFLGLLNLYKNTTQPIIDLDNKFVQISNKEILGTSFKDSLRMFDVSLNKLCINFNIESKIGGKYDNKFNNPEILNNPSLCKEFIEYGIQDTVSLFKVLEHLQYKYLSKYYVDICDIWSAATLSLKIYRINFLKETIPSLNNDLDKFCRLGYYGGATDYYYQHIKSDIYHYDVNSLYPAAMCNKIPTTPNKYFPNMKNINLNNFFGFATAKITHIKGPTLLPYKHETLGTIYPTGTWIGTYFSEELKNVVTYGYKVELIKGWSFHSSDLFSEFVHHFYNIKKNNDSNISERWIAKQTLNVLYGYFGRDRNKIITKVCTREECDNLIDKYEIRSVEKMVDGLWLLLLEENKLNLKGMGICGNTPTDTELNLHNLDNAIKSNVAISAAVTAYGRILMNKYKTLLGYEIYYTDTESIFTNKPLPKELVGSELGMMKNELGNIALNGKAIEGIFLGIKRYAIKYIDLETKEIKYKYVFSSVKKGYLKWDDYLKLLNGDTLSITMPNSFVHDFKKFDYFY
jgi:DNA polymerase type B, organellar and viral